MSDTNDEIREQILHVNYRYADHRQKIADILQAICPFPKITIIKQPTGYLLHYNADKLTHAAADDTRSDAERRGDFATRAAAEIAEALRNFGLTSATHNNQFHYATLTLSAEDEAKLDLNPIDQKRAAAAQARLGISGEINTIAGGDDIATTPSHESQSDNLSNVTTSVGNITPIKNHPILEQVFALSFCGDRSDALTVAKSIIDNYSAELSNIGINGQELYRQLFEGNKKAGDAMMRFEESCKDISKGRFKQGPFTGIMFSDIYHALVTNKTYRAPTH